MTFGTFRIIPFLIGGVIIFGMQAMKRFSEKRQLLPPLPKRTAAIPPNKTE